MTGFKIGTAHASKGSKSYGTINVSKTASGSEISIPVLVVKGVEEGPILCVDSAHHGNEVVGSIAIAELGRMIDPNKMKGTFIGVPIVNVPAFEDQTRLTNRFDHLNLNRVYPGREDGSMTERISFTYFNEVILKCNYLISFHSSEYGSYVILPSATMRPKEDEIAPEIENKCEEMARVFGVELISTGIPHRGYLILEAAKKGIPGIMPEIGGLANWHGNYDAIINVAIRGVKNIMKNLGMIEGIPELPKKQRIVRTTEAITSKYGGFWMPKVKMGDEVDANEVLGTISHPITGEVLEQIRSSSNGIVTYCRAWPVVNFRGYSFVCCIAKIIKTLKN